MTQEEKAKAYDEAIERAKNFIENGDERERTIAESIFAGIMEESEDERIRKEMLQIAKESEDSFYMVMTPNKRERLIAWLEKQCEQKFSDIDNKFIRMRETKPKDISEFLDRLTTVEQEFLWEHIAKIRELDKEEQKPADKIQLGKKYKCIASPRYSTFMLDKIYKPEDKFLCSLMNFCSDCFEPIEDEHKPADKIQPKFKIGDIIRFKGNETLKGEAETHKIVSYDNELYVFDDGTTDLFCEQDLYELVEQKPWSEEDENLFKSCITRIQMVDSDVTLIDWLKSLKDRYTWKPSDEQMEALDSATENCAYSEYQDCLRELIGQLKKLK